ncbi:hypothetical protein EV702DRAFT_1198298 [Suillus placidus]|uniref:Uncharacterized protein n=1 Tax=Suillus placidus TaxID=48579 RepID=A0A9P6ZU77_9AGAM|nr:hypothetical protein EV702DRAFT_1198298 [Suillus placidus]
MSSVPLCLMNARLAARQRTFILSLMQTSSRQPRKCPRPHRHAGAKSVMVDDDNDDDDPQESSITRHCPPPKPRPLARSKCSGPMTSSAEEEIFEASFSRRSSMIQNTPDVATDQQSPHKEISANIQDGNVETTPALVTEAHSTTASKDPNPASEIPSNDPNDGTSATPTESHNTGHGSKDHGKDTSAARAESHSADDGGNNSATPATGHPRRSCGVKSYAPDRNDGEESSPSDSDWGANQEQRKKAQRAAVDAAANNGDDDEGSPATNPPSPSWLTATQKQKSKVMADINENIDSKDEDDEEDFELGKNTLEAARVLRKEYGKSVRTILIEAGLTMKATRKESLWNQHQTWFAATCPPPKGVLGAVSPADLKAWKVKQQAHYKAHPHSDPQHASVWKEILENWDRAVAGSTEDLTSQSAAGLMMAVRDAFTKLAAYWHRTHGIHIAGVAIFPGDEEAGRQASGLFAGSDMVKALINSHQLDIKRWLDELTTILKYKDLEAAHAEGKTFSLLPPSSTTLNGTLLCNGKPARDRNRKVAPMMISEKFAEAGHPLKTSNSRWLTMLDILYAEKLCIHDWPAGVPPPGPDFDLKALSASQLHALVAPYLRIHLGALYEAELGLDDNDNDSEAEAAKAKKHKCKSKKSGDKGRKKGPIVEEPSVVLHISRWPESDILAFEMQASNACLIPLVIDTDGRVVRPLQDLEKFIKDLPPDDTPRHRTNEVIKKPAISNPAASRSTKEALRSTIGASRSTMGASRFNNAAPSSNREASRSRQYTNRAIHEDLPPSSPPQEAPRSCHPTNRVFDDLPPSSPSTPSSQFSSPPLILRSSTPVPTSDYSHVRSRSRYKPSHNGALRHQHAYNDVMPTYNPDIHKRTRPHYESAQETEDLEREMVEERRRVRVYDNSRIHSGWAESQIISTSRSRLPSCSSVVPTSCAGSSVVPISRASSSQHRHYPTVRSSCIRPASPDRRLIIEEDEYY